MAPSAHNYDYDLLVIGSGPAGQRAAIQAAKVDRRVALIEKRSVLGGVSVNTGTIPSKTLREAVLDLSGYGEREFYGLSHTLKKRIGMPDLLQRVDTVVRHEIDVTRAQLLRNRVDVFSATASFEDAHTLRLDYVDGSGQRSVSAAYIIIASGTEATRDEHIPFDGRRVLTSDDILTLDALPRTLVVIGAGVIGCEYASMFAALGVRVTLVDRRPRLLPFVDAEIADTLGYLLRENRVMFRLNETVKGIEVLAEEETDHVRITLDSGKQIVTEKALYSIGRTGNTSRLNLQKAGILPDDRGRIEVNGNYQTKEPHIYAVGDVIGFPSLASTSMEQGRLAACHALGIQTTSVPELFPYGIYTIPEISMVGRNEEELTQEGIPYEAGKARYREIARGQILGDTTGLLKLLFHLETRRLLGVHIIGEGASELVHIGQAVLAFGGTVDYFVNTVFNYPTLAECYKTAAFDGINRIGQVRQCSQAD
jgi:NAD(P) transhydrogenase